MNEELDRSARALELSDRAEIQDAMVLLTRAFDSRGAEAVDRLGRLGECLTDDIHMDYPFASWDGIPDTAELIRSTLHKLYCQTMHMIGNAIIKVDGDTATAEYYTIAAHVPATTDGGRGFPILGGAVYQQELRRTPAGWRICRHAEHDSKIWTLDDGSLMQSLSVATEEAGYGEQQLA